MGKKIKYLKDKHEFVKFNKFPLALQLAQQAQSDLEFEQAETSSFFNTTVLLVGPLYKPLSRFVDYNKLKNAEAKNNKRIF